jgi:hypothetical protein
LLADTSSISAYNVAWELESYNTWLPYSHPSSWEKNSALAIWPIICTTTGIDEEKLPEMNCFPNPAQNTITVSLDRKFSQPTNINIVNLFGQICYSARIEQDSDFDFKIDISKIPEGIYLLSINTTSIKLVRKILILR